MLIKDKDILAQKTPETNEKKVQVRGVNKRNMKSAWGDAFDYYIRGITERYLRFHGRATRLEFWGFMLVSGLVFVPLYFLGVYADIPLLAYYYGLATAIPTAAVAVRRLHDIHKNAFLCFGLGIVGALSAFFIGYWSLIAVALWLLWMIYLFSKETDPEEGIYGEANEDDEIYGSDNVLILRKFRFLALVLMFSIMGLTYLKFDNWSTQEGYKSTNEDIMEKLEKKGKKMGLTTEQIGTAREMMKVTLKSWSGKVVPEEDIDNAILQSLKNAKPDDVQEPEVNP